MIKNIILFKSQKDYIKNGIYINCKKNKDLFEEIRKINFDQINIYDMTYRPQAAEGEVVEVGDHINKTGENPLIGNQHKLKEQFIDISKLYKNPNGVTTTCLGGQYETHKKKFAYPSTHMCQVSIIAKAIGKNKVKGFLINRFC
jgi:hypothetical protein